MKFRDWFDINNKEHLEAFIHLLNTDFWPRNFLPKEYRNFRAQDLMHSIASQLASHHYQQILKLEHALGPRKRKAPWQDKNGKFLFEGDLLINNKKVKATIIYHNEENIIDHKRWVVRFKSGQTWPLKVFISREEAIKIND